MPPKKTAREEYLRDRFLKVGARGFMPKDAVELLLGYCISGDRVYSVVEALFDRFRSISEILNADPQELAEVPGMNENAALLIGLLPYIFRLNSSLRAAGSKLDGSASACRYFLNSFRGANVEQFKVACLDENMIPFRCETIGRGSTFLVDINAEEVIKCVLSSKCRLCIVAHNHPGGSCVPSASDLASTAALAAELERIGAELVDHIIIGREGARSMFDPSGRIYLPT